MAISHIRAVLTILPCAHRVCLYEERRGSLLILVRDVLCVFSGDVVLSFSGGRFVADFFHPVGCLLFGGVAGFLRNVFDIKRYYYFELVVLLFHL